MLGAPTSAEECTLPANGSIRVLGASLGCATGPFGVCILTVAFLFKFLFGHKYFVIWTNIYCNFNKYIFHLDLNIFCNNLYQKSIKGTSNDARMIALLNWIPHCRKFRIWLGSLLHIVTLPQSQLWIECMSSFWQTWGNWDCWRWVGRGAGGSRRVRS